MSVIHPYEGTVYAIEYVSLKFREECRAGNANLVAINLEIASEKKKSMDGLPLWCSG